MLKLSIQNHHKGEGIEDGRRTAHWWCVSNSGDVWLYESLYMFATSVSSSGGRICPFGMWSSIRLA